MTEEEIREELASVNAAIRAIREGAQEYKVMNRTVRKAEYATLLKERTALERRLSVLTGECLSYGGWPGR